MSRYLVVSDNHGNLDNLKMVLKKYGNEIDGLIHCGDMTDFGYTNLIEETDRSRYENGQVDHE